MIYFLSGALRSGSTLLHLMLDHHPGLKNPGEFDFMFDLIGDDGRFPVLDDYYAFLEKNRIFKAKALKIDKSLDFVNLIQSFADQLKPRDGILVLNVHRNFHRIPYVFPDAKYLHLIRDPRDVARSSIEMGWCGNVFFGVDHWLASERSWDILADQLTETQSYSVYYEDLVVNPEHELSKLCAFINVSYSPKMLDYPLNSSYKKPDKSLVSQWRHRLSELEVQYVESKAGVLMLSRGYPLSGLPILQVSSLEKLRLLWQNKMFRFSHSVKRYGYALYIKELLSRWLGLKQLQKQFLLEKHQIDIKHLR
jgi:hypothetical protein